MVSPLGVGTVGVGGRMCSQAKDYRSQTTTGGSERRGPSSVGWGWMR